MMKKAILIWCFVFVFALTACSGNEPSEPSRSSANSNHESSEIETEKATEKETEHINDESDESVPKDLPIYPGSEMALALPTYGFNGMVWWFESPGSGKEIFDFYTTELKKAGLEINDEYSGLEGFTFEIHTVNEVVTVINNEAETISSEVTPDTPGREYIISVDFDKWNER